MIADGISAGGTQAAPTYEAIDVENLKWKQAVNPTVTAYELKPLAYNSNAKILVEDLANDPSAALPAQNAPTETDWNSSSAKYATFVLYFKNASTSSTDVYLKSLSVKHPETVSTNALYDKDYELPAKSIVDLDANYAAFGFTKNAQTGVISHNTPTYTVDALRVLQFDVTATQVGTVDTDDDYAAETEVVYDIEANATKLVDDLANGFNAHTYYNAIMDDDLSITTDKTVKTVLNGTGTTAGKAVKIGKVPSAGTAATINHVLKVEFKVFLNGWDLACFDACQGQRFVIDMEFTSDAPNGERTYVVTA